jgi:hypothetical protein
MDQDRHIGAQELGRASISLKEAKQTVQVAKSRNLSGKRGRQETLTFFYSCRYCVDLIYVTVYRVKRVPGLLAHDMLCHAVIKVHILPIRSTICLEVIMYVFYA